MRRRSEACVSWQAAEIPQEMGNIRKKEKNT